MWMAQKLLEILRMILTEEQKRMHTAYGLHSNIPACCVDYYIHEWIAHDHLISDGSPHALRIKQLKREMGEIHAPWYIPCPECLQHRRFNQIHLCEGCPEQSHFLIERDRIGVGFATAPLIEWT
jgi:hypothetical protein